MASTLRSMYEQVFGTDDDVKSARIMKEKLTTHYTNLAHDEADAVFKKSLDQYEKDLKENVESRKLQQEIDKLCKTSRVLERELSLQNKQINDLLKKKSALEPKRPIRPQVNVPEISIIENLYKQ